MPRSLALIALLITSFAYVPFTGAQASRPLLEDGRIAFTSNIREDYEQSGWEIFQIHRMNPDGTETQRLTYTDRQYERVTDDLTPAWSPDGTRIAFTRRIEQQNNEIFVMDADGDNVRRLTDSASDDDEPVWSPDGTKIAYTAVFHDDAGVTSDLMVMNADGSGQRKLTHDPGKEAGPDWSPDGQEIVFSASPGPTGNTDIYVMDSDGSSWRQLTHTPYQSEVAPDWSPDGQRIAFMAEIGEIDIYVMKADGSGVHQVTEFEDLRESFSPSWSPDGQRIAFAAGVETEAETFEIYVVNADGSGLTQITTNRVRDGDPDWEPLPIPSVADATVREGKVARLTVTLAALPAVEMRYGYATLRGRARASKDFVAETGVLTFAAGERTQTITIKTTEDDARERDEPFSLQVSNSRFGSDRASVTIRDDD